MFGITVVKQYEKEFETKTLENKHVFYDLYIKSEDPQELRARIAQELTDKDYKILLNEMTKFDENSELEEAFRGGNIKPIRILIKAAKDRRAGAAYPTLWKAFLGITIILLILTILNSRGLFYGNSGNYPSPYLIYGTLASFILFLVFLLFRYVVPIFVWSKIIGIYQAGESTAEVRIVLAGDCQFADKRSYELLEADLSEIYTDISRKYQRKASKEEYIENIPFRSEQSQKLMSKLREIEYELADLEKNFAAGKIGEEAYKETKKELELKKSEIEALVDVLMP